MICHNASASTTQENPLILQIPTMEADYYVAFTDPAKAEAFERYLKSGSGHAFARKRLW
jgi:hypothetical protein